MLTTTVSLAPPLSWEVLAVISYSEVFLQATGCVMRSHVYVYTFMYVSVLTSYIPGTRRMAIYHREIARIMRIPRQFISHHPQV